MADPLLSKTVGAWKVTVRPAADAGCVKAEAWTVNEARAGTVIACTTPSGTPLEKAKRLNVRLAQSHGKRGERIGTRLYETLAEYACANGLKLGSDVTRSKVAEAFWRKQYDKKRADHYCITETYRVVKNRIRVSERWKKCPPDDDLVYRPDGLSIEKSKYRSQRIATRYALKSCPAPMNLEGMKRRRKK